MSVKAAAEAGVSFFACESGQGSGDGPLRSGLLACLFPLCCSFGGTSPLTELEGKRRFGRVR
jgi:hypothetical protein